MEGRLVFKDCAILRTDGRLKTGLAVAVEGERIARVALDADVPVLPGDWAVPCSGRALLPGRVDCHAQMVNAQLLPETVHGLLVPTRARREAMRASSANLSAGEVEALAAFACARALRLGVTCVHERLWSPSFVHAGLQVYGRVAERMGLRLLLSHASSAEAQLEENAAFVHEQRAHRLVRGAVGVGTLSDLDDAFLKRAARDDGGMLSATLGESALDLEESVRRHGRRELDRLEMHGLLGRRLMAGYARALNQDEVRRLKNARAFVAICPRAEQREPPVGDVLLPLLENGLDVGLGSGGAPSPIVDRHAAVNTMLGPARAMKLLDADALLGRLLYGGPAELVGRAFGDGDTLARVGEVEEGALADLVLYDFTPAEKNGGAYAALFDAGDAPAAWVTVNGRVVVREGRLLSADGVELGKDAARVVARHGVVVS